MGKDFIDRYDTRRHLPILILNLDGALGFWDYTKEMYVLRHKVFDNLPNLSHDFILVAVSQQPKMFIQRVVEQLLKLSVQENPNSYPPIYN